MQNLTNYMTQVNTEKNKTLDGLVITPYNQNFKRKNDEGISIFEIAQDEELLKRFPYNTFPKIVKMDDGSLFIDPIGKIIHTMDSYYIKWLLINDDFDPVHDHDYQYVKIPKTGYLMKVVVPILEFNSNGIQCEYVVDINNIPFKEYIQNTDNIVTMTKTEENKNVVDLSNINTSASLEIPLTNMMEYPKIFALIHSDDFFDKYIKHIAE